MTYVLTWVDIEYTHVHLYKNFEKAHKAFVKLSCNDAIYEGYLEEYNRKGDMIQDWVFMHG